MHTRPLEATLCLWCSPQLLPGCDQLHQWWTWCWHGPHSWFGSVCASWASWGMHAGLQVALC